MPDETPKPADTISLTIDGVAVSVPKGTTVLQAAEKAGLDVPRYCYHPGLTIAGNCRICLVDVEKMPKLATSCTTLAAEGMVVRTGGEKVEDGRRAVMEFLLANHPLDCPICDQAGECRLQEYSFQHGSGGQRFVEERIKGFKQKPVGTHIVLDTERCIVCTRCIRFCDEVTGTGELGVFQRGAFSYIDTFPGRGLDNPYSGNTVDICPVGALTLKEFRFKKRVWWIKDVPSVCGSCARGCSVNLGTADNTIYRLTPRENPRVNKWWMCDEGRLSIHAPAPGARLGHAMARDNGEQAVIDHPVALERLATRLKAARPGGVGIIASASLTLEDLWMVRRLAAECLRDARVVVPEVRRGEDDAILIRADKTANRKGAEMLGLPLDTGDASLAALLEDARAGSIEVLLVLGHPIDGPVKSPGGAPFVCAALTHAGGLADAADLVIPTAAYGEFEGTWVNFAGHAQRVRRGLVPTGIALDVWLLIAELMRSMGVPVRFASSADVLSEIASKCEAFRPLAIYGGPVKALGAQGVTL